MNLLSSLTLEQEARVEAVATDFVLLTLLGIDTELSEEESEQLVRLEKELWMLGVDLELLITTGDIEALGELQLLTEKDFGHN